MQPPRQVSLPLIGLVASCVCLGASPQPSPAWRALVGHRLLEAYDSSASTGAAQTTPGPAIAGAASLPHPIRTDGQGRTQIDIHYDCSSTAVTQQLTAAGFSPGTSIHLSPVCAIEGWIALSALPQIAIIPGVRRIDAPSY